MRGLGSSAVGGGDAVNGLVGSGRGRRGAMYRAPPGSDYPGHASSSAASAFAAFLALAAVLSTTIRTPVPIMSHWVTLYRP